MRRVRSLCFAILCGLFSSLAHGAVFVAEPFDLPAGPLAGQGSGSGWSNDWGTFFGASVVDSGSLSFASGSALTASGNKMVTSVSAQTISFREKANAINAGIEGTYYITFLLQRQASANQISEVQVATGGVQTLVVGSSSSGFARVGIFDGGQTVYTSVPNTDPNYFNNNGNTYQFIAKFVLHADDTPDEGYVSVFNTATDTLPMTEPTSWGASVFVDNDNTPGTQNPIVVLTGGGIAFDEIGIYTSYSDIVSIPEPSSPIAAAVLLAATCRRRRR